MIKPFDSEAPVARPLAIHVVESITVDTIAVAMRCFLLLKYTHGIMPDHLLSWTNLSCPTIDPT